MKGVLTGYDLKKFVFGLIDKTKDHEEKENNKPRREEKKNNNIINISDSSENDNENSNNVVSSSVLGRKRGLKEEETKEERNNNIIQDFSQRCKKINNNNKKEFNSEFLSSIISSHKDLYLNTSIFIKNLCHCNLCELSYKKIGFGFLCDRNVYKEWEKRITFDEVINQDQFIEEAKKENPVTLDKIKESVNSYLKSKEYLDLPYEQQFFIKNCILILANEFNDYVASLDHPNLKIEDIYTFCKKYKGELRKIKNDEDNNEEE